MFITICILNDNVLWLLARSDSACHELSNKLPSKYGTSLLAQYSLRCCHERIVSTSMRARFPDVFLGLTGASVACLQFSREVPFQYGTSLLVSNSPRSCHLNLVRRCLSTIRQGFAIWVKFVSQCGSWRNLCFGRHQWSPRKDCVMDRSLGLIGAYRHVKLGEYVKNWIQNFRGTAFHSWRFLEVSRPWVFLWFLLEHLDVCAELQVRCSCARKCLATCRESGPWMFLSLPSEGPCSSCFYYKSFSPPNVHIPLDRLFWAFTNCHCGPRAMAHKNCVFVMGGTRCAMLFVSSNAVKRVTSACFIKVPNNWLVSSGLPNSILPRASQLS